MTGRTRSRLTDDRGAVALTVAISMIVILGMSAIALDGGRGMTERRQARNAADHAALTAAWTSCQWSSEASTYPDPVTAGIAEGEASAALNHYDGVTDNTVTITFIGDLTLNPPEHRYEVTILSDIGGTFSSVIGAGDTIQVTGYAVANCDWVQGPGNYAIFAGATGCGPTEINITGSSQEIVGGIHSNGELAINGNAADPSDIYGPVSYVEDVALSGVNLWDDAAPPGTNPGFAFVTPIQPYPVSFNIAWYEPGGVRAVAAGADYYSFSGPGWTVLSGAIAEGLYFVDGDLRLNDVQAEHVTFVATGKIAINGNTAVNTNPANPATAPWDPDGLSIFSNEKETGAACNTNSIQWSSSGVTWGGTQYAPNGAIDMSGASNSVFDGSIIAYTVNLSGSDINFSASSTDEGTRLSVLELED